MEPLLFPDDPSFEFEVQRTLGHAVCGGAGVAGLVWLDDVLADRGPLVSPTSSREHA